MPATARNFMDNIAEAIEDIFPDKDNTGKAYKAMHSVLNAPSDYEGMTVGDVLEQFGKMLDTLRDMSNLPDSYPIMAVCGRAEYAITHNGQPIRRRDEADTL